MYDRARASLSPPTEEHFVFSRTPRAPDKNVTFVEHDFYSFVSGFKSRSGGTMWSVGDREPVDEAVRLDLLDEIIVSIHPVIFGGGISLFPRELPKRQLEFVRSEHFNSGLVLVWYQRPR